LLLIDARGQGHRDKPRDVEPLRDAAGVVSRAPAFRVCCGYDGDVGDRGMTRQVISSGGPFEQVYGYSRAVRVGAQVHVAGTVARGEALAGDAYVQTQNVLATIRSALKQAGARVEDVVRTVIYVTNIGDADLVGRGHSEVFGDIRPASTLVQVSALIRPEMLVEIEAYAVVDET
jgi:enamine deaminase RidA (YjgF/YER057c/UK114 family)